MRRVLIFVLFALLGVVPLGAGSPVDGMFSQRAELKAGVWSTTRDFRGGEQAAVLALGQNDAPFNLEVSVFNAANELVAQDKADGTLTGNLVGVVWYPPADGPYRIEVRHPTPGVNTVYVAVK